MHCCFSWTLEDGNPLQTTFPPPPPTLSEFHRINVTHVHPERRGVMSDMCGHQNHNMHTVRPWSKHSSLTSKPKVSSFANLRLAPLQPFLYWQVMVMGLSGVHLPVQWESNLFIMSMITNWLGGHKVSLPINHKNYNFGEKEKSQVMKEKICCKRLTGEA